MAAGAHKCKSCRRIKGGRCMGDIERGAPFATAIHVKEDPITIESSRMGC